MADWTKAKDLILGGLTEVKKLSESLTSDSLSGKLCRMFVVHLATCIIHRLSNNP